MKTRRLIIIVSFFSFLSVSLFMLSACNDDGNDKFLGSRYFTFNTAIDPETLTQEDSFRISNPEMAPRDESYAIESDIDLDAFNQTLDGNDQVSIDDLNIYTYFFIRDPDCPEYFDYSKHRYSNNELTITLYHFREPPDTVCPAWITELYLVFKAEKSF